MIPNTFTQRGVLVEEAERSARGNPQEREHEGQHDGAYCPVAEQRPLAAAHANLAAVRACLRRHSQTPTACPTKTAMTVRPSRSVEGDVTRNSAP